MGQQSISTLTLSFKASGAVVRRRAVGFGGAQATVKGQKVLGVSPREAGDGSTSDVEVSGTTVIETGGAFSTGDSLIVDVQGRAIASTGGLTIAAGAIAVLSTAANGAVLSGGDGPEYVFADALEASTGEGRFVEVLLRR
jgi:hypothetical protein